MSARSLLVRGMLVGLAAGVLAYLFATAFGETLVNAAIAFEDAHTPPGDHDPELVSRTIQSTIGLATAVVVYGAALGGIVALAFAVVYGRLGRNLTARLGAWNAVLAAAGAFVAVVAVAAALLPVVNEVPADFPAAVLWRFRLASLGTQLVLWTTLGLLFGALTDRGERRRARTPEPVAVA